MHDHGVLAMQARQQHSVDGLRREIAHLTTLLESITSAVHSIETAPVQSFERLAEIEYRRRRVRAKAFGGYNFDREPAWDILLDLFAKSIAQSHHATSSVCIASCVPTTTALRHIDVLEREGLIQASRSKEDRRVRSICLSEKGRRCSRRYFSMIQPFDS